MQLNDLSGRVVQSILQGLRRAELAVGSGEVGEVEGDRPGMEENSER
jgi:hypothetical protein